MHAVSFELVANADDDDKLSKSKQSSIVANKCLPIFCLN